MHNPVFLHACIYNNDEFINFSKFNIVVSNCQVIDILFSYVITTFTPEIKGASKLCNYSINDLIAH